MSDIYTATFEKLTHLKSLLHRQQISANAEYGPMANPACGQGRVIAMLKMQPELSVKDLAYLLGIRQQSLNELLNKLEKSEFITRKLSEADKRVTIISLTEKGKEAEYPESDEQNILSGLTEEDLEKFNEYLDKIIKSLENLLGDEKEKHEKGRKGKAHGRMRDMIFDALITAGEKHMKESEGHSKHGKGSGHKHGKGRHD